MTPFSVSIESEADLGTIFEIRSLSRACIFVLLFIYGTKWYSEVVGNGPREPIPSHFSNLPSDVRRWAIFPLEAGKTRPG